MRRIRVRLEGYEQGFGDWAAANGVRILRVALGIVFVWFGVLKFCPGLCDVEVMAAIPVKVCLCVLAVAETGIGILLIAGRAMRTTTICLMLHLCGTFLPMLLFPDETWKHFPYAPTLVGQYILKNMVLMAAAVVVAAGAFARSTARKAPPIRRSNLVPIRSFHMLNSLPKTSGLLVMPAIAVRPGSVIRRGWGTR